MDMAVRMQALNESGLLDLDTDVNQYLKSWQVPVNGSWQPRITLRQLLSHSAGTTVHGFFGSPRRVAPPLTARDVLEGRADSRPVRVDTLPAVHARYSGGGTTIVQMLLEDLTATPFPTLVEELIFAPLGMADSGYDRPGTAAEGGPAATGHRPNGEKLPQEYHVYPELAANGLWSTPTDLARLMIGLHEARLGRSGRLLSPESAAAMLTPQGESGYGLGVTLVRADESYRLQQTFTTAGFSGLIAGHPESGTGAVIMLNHEWGLRDELLAEIARTYDWPLTERERTLQQMSVRTPGAPVPAAVLGALAGEYEARPDLRFRVTAQGGTLLLTPTGQDPLVLVPVTRDHFYAADLVVTVTFQRDGDGAVTGLTLHQDQQDLPAAKLA